MQNIGPFKLYTKKPNDIHYGKIYTTEVELPVLYSKKRTVRVYIPEDFDGVMGVPITFLSKFNPEQFVIEGITENAGVGLSNGIIHKDSPYRHPLINGVRKYHRILIRRRKEA